MACRYGCGIWRRPSHVHSLRRAGMGLSRGDVCIAPASPVASTSAPVIPLPARSCLAVTMLAHQASRRSAHANAAFRIKRLALGKARTQVCSRALHITVAQRAQQQIQQHKARQQKTRMGSSGRPLGTGKTLSQVASAAAGYIAMNGGEASDHHREHAHPLVRRVKSTGQRLGRYREILMRFAVTLLLLIVLRCGHFIPLPGVDMQQLPSAAASTEGERMIRALYGQARELPASLFDLGISPLINASIIMTVLLVLPEWLLPGPAGSWLARLKEARKEGKSGEAHLNTYINYFGLTFAAYNALVRAFELEPYALFPGWFILRTALALVSGTAIIQYCASLITAYGIGNGTTLVVVTSIITGYAETLHTVLCRFESGGLALWKAGGAAMLGYLALVTFTVYLCGSELRLPVVQYTTAVTNQAAPDSAGRNSMQRMFAQARRLVDQRMQRNDYFPILLNSSGMMPIILASALYYGFLPAGAHLLKWPPLVSAISALHGSLLGLLPYGVLVALMEFVPVGGINPKEVAEYLGTLNVGIRGVVPGEPTEEYVSQQLLRCKFWGGLALGGLAVTAQLFDILCSAYLGSTLATPSLLIIVGAVLQSARQVEALMEGPKLQQRLDNERQLIQSLAVL